MAQQHQVIVSAEGDKHRGKQEKKRARAQELALAEANWQEDIVRVRGGIDGAMLTIILVLVAFGSIAVFSASYPEAVRKTGDGMTYIRSQIGYVLLGLAAMTVVVKVPINFWRRWAPIAAYALAAVLLIAALFIGTSEGVTKRWIDLGPVNIQPSEVMKLAIILMIAWYFDKYEEQMNNLRQPFKEQYKWNTIYPIVILGGACVLVLVGKHLSGTIIVGMIGLLMLIVGGCRLKWLFATGIPLAAAAIGGFLALNPYALKRITTKLDENADKLDELYQTTQSIYAIGSGGLFGVGLGESRQKFSYLTAAHTDFIFAVWCEEWGFLGALALILCFLLFMWRGYVIALRAPDKFTMLTAFGITTHVGIQAFFNMCVVADMFPNTGITLPFFSYGGSSLVVLLFEMGILLAISKQYYRKKSDLRKK
jgi:cell division protein FtsW